MSGRGTESGWLRWAYREADYLTKDIPAALAEDAKQEAMLGFVKACATYDPERGSFRWWALLKMRFAIAEWWRTEDYLYRTDRDRRKAGVESYEDHRGKTKVLPERPSALLESDLAVWSSDERVELRLDLVRLLGALPDRQKRIAFLYWYVGYGQREIGEMYGLTESRVNQILSAIGRRARSELDGMLPEPVVQQPRRLALDPTEKELDVLRLGARGWKDAAMAEALGIGLDSVHDRWMRVIARLGARNRTHAVALAWRRGLIE